MTTIGYATLAIVPSLRGVSDSINKQLAAMPDVGKDAGKHIGNNIAAGVRASDSGRKIGKDLEDGVARGADGAAGQVKTRLSERLGSQVGSVVGKGIGAGIKLGIAGAAGAAALAVGGIGIALSKGFDRLQSIDQAKFKLQALGNSAADVQTIMDNALESVQGTKFGLQDAATAAASAVAAGIKPGQDLTKYLKEVGDAAAVAGTNFNDMGAIFGKIQTSNKAYTDDLQQLSDRGLPIFQWLQKEYGVTGDKLSEMVQKGEVDSAHFQDAIDKNLGGAAQKMGESFDGAVDKMEAAVARLGANFITAILGGDPSNALEGPTQAITNLTGKFDQIGIWVNAHRAEIHGFFIDVKNVAVEVGGAIKNITTWLVENKGAAETLAAVFVGWKVATTIAGVVESLKTMSTLLRVTLPADAAVAGSGISAGFAAALPVIGQIMAAYELGKTNPIMHGDTQPGQTVQGQPSMMQDGNGNPVRLQDGKIVPVPKVPGGGAPGAQRERRGLAPAPLPPNAYDPFKLLPGHAMGGVVRGFAGGGVFRGFDSGGQVTPGGGMDDRLRLFYDPNYRTTDTGAFNPNVVLDPSNTDSGPDNAMDILMYAKQGLRTTADRRHFMGIFYKQYDDGWFGATNFPQGILPKGTKKPPNRNGWAKGGKLPGYSPGVDNMLVPLSGGEGIIIPEAMRALGSNWLYNLNSKFRGGLNRSGYADGGVVGVDAFKKYASQITGGRYVRGGPAALTGTDCSGAQAALANFLTGGSGRFATGNEAQALASRGFQMGDPPPGVTAYWVGWKNGGPGGGHTSGTIIDPKGGNVNVEMGGASGGGAYGGPAGGASRFPNRAWIQIAGGQDPQKPNNNNFVGGEDPNAPDNFTGGSSNPTLGIGGSLPSSLSGLASFGLDSLGSGAGTTSGGSDLSVFGKAAGSAVSGQISSALGVFGVNDSPGWLKAATQLVGGIKVSGKDGTPIFDGANPLGSVFGQRGAGASAVPLSAISNATGTPPPDGMVHGSRAGQAPGPQTVYNIRTATVEDAFLAAQRKQQVRMASKMDRY